MINLTNILRSTDSAVATAMTSAWQQYLDKYWMVAAAALLVLALIIILLIRKRNNKKAHDSLDDVSKRLNGLKSVPLPYKLSKAVALARTKKDIGDSVNQCQGDFDTVQKNLKKMQNMISDGEELVMMHKMGMEKKNIADITALQNETETLVNSLSAKLDDILQKETAEREKVNDLKEAFRGLKIRINNEAANYVFCWEALEKKITGIEKEFSNFEELMYASEFEKASALMGEIKQSIEQLNEIVEKIPELITVAKGDLPVLGEDVRSNYQQVEQKGAYLNHLNAAAILETVNASQQQCLQKIKNVEIEDVNEKLLDCEAKLTQLNQQIEQEASAYDKLTVLRQATDDDLAKLTAKMATVTNAYDKQSEHYGFEGWHDKLSGADSRLKELTAAYNSLTQTLQGSGVPSSTILLSLETIDHDILACYSEISNMASAIEGANYDEERARNQLTKLDVVVAEVEAKIRLNRLPAISQQYDADLAKANDFINRLQETLDETPLNVSILNPLLSMAIDFIYKLYESVSRILGTAIMVENAIVVGNRYRSSYSEIDSELTRAELAYRNGEYTQALSIALKAIEKVHPTSVSKLLKAHKEAAA